MKIYPIGFISLLMIIPFQSCMSKNYQTHESDTIPDRQPAVAGSFYPARPDSLKAFLKRTFAEAMPSKHEDVIAIVSPHAGYVYSAKVAASAFNQIDTSKTYEHIFVIGSSHRNLYDGASVYPSGNFITPLGKIPVDTLGETLIRESRVFTSDISPQLQEHSIEVQLPFLQYLLKKKFSIVPILLGTQSPETCRKIANALRPYFNDRNLFIVSTDFSHYPQYNDAERSDSMMAEAVKSNSVKDFLATKDKVENSDVPNLLTGMCGWTSVLTLLNITQTEGDVAIEEIDHQNSGDVSFGDKERVVGYVALAVVKADEEKPETEFNLTEPDKLTLLSIARNAITSYLTNKKIPNIKKDTLSQSLLFETGAFVTLQEDGQLRGCVGTFRPSGEIYTTIQNMVIAAATNDTRFEPVQAAELGNIKIEISVLTPLKKIKSINEITLGKHGIYIVKGNKTGTLLPQVPEKYGWTREEFLGYCSRDKAGIGWNGWRSANIYTYEAIIFSEK